MVYVTGCDVVPNSYGSSAFYRWNGAAFAPLSSPGHGSAIATLAGTSYTIGGDAMLYSSNNDGAWVKRTTPSYQPITDIGADRAGIWIITSQVSGNGDGNAIYRRNGYNDLIDMQGAGKTVALDTASNAWAITNNGEIWRRSDHTAAGTPL
ncbi:MAG: hypothetical protein ACREPB_07400 [Arenimonas sp.]